MPPRNQPSSLYQLCIKNSLRLLYGTCKAIAEAEFKECKKQKIEELRCFLMATLPATIFDALCLERLNCRNRAGDTHIQLQVLIHPKMTIFRKARVDEHILSQQFWIKTIPSFSNLLVLDLRYVCTDEILEIIATKCLRLEKLNIRSRYDICNTDVNASALISHVSDVGLCCLKSLKQLRTLTMDRPRNKELNPVGRCVTQAGIVKLLREIPYLEQLIIPGTPTISASPSDSCDIGSILSGADIGIGPLSLRKVNYYSATAEGIRKLIKICPRIKDLFIVCWSPNDLESVMQELTASDLRLNVLYVIVSFSSTESLQRVLQVQGKYLTHFLACDNGESLNIDTLVDIGRCCPNLVSLQLATGSNDLFIPRLFRRPDNLFPELECLTLNGNFKLEDIVLFFLEHAKKLSKLVLVLKYNTKVNELLLYALNKGYLSNIRHLELQNSQEVSKDVVIQIIESCNKLTYLWVDLEGNDEIQIAQYIHKNNFDLKLCGY